MHTRSVSMESIPSSLQRRSPISSAIDMEEVNNFKRKKPLEIDWKMIFSTDDDVDDRPPEIVITSAVKSTAGGGGGGGRREAKTEKEDAEYQKKSDRELEDMIPRIKQNILKLSDKLPDKGEKFKATLKRCEDEVERRKKICGDKVLSLLFP